jgi:Flp pilus assembly protein TadD
VEACPVCPYAGLGEADLTCPACGTDLTVLRRFQELPAVMVNDGIRRHERGDLDGAVRCFQAAAAFPRTRERALVLLGACALERRNSRLADSRYWRAAAALRRRLGRA